MKKSVLISNIILLFWYFLAMIGIKIGDKYLVEGSFKAVSYTHLTLPTT